MSLNYQFAINLAEQYRPAPGVFLDFGCGAAEIAALALDRGYDAYGVDTYLGVGHTPKNLAVASDRIGPRVSTISPDEPMPFADDFFDVIVSNQVFEHVSEIALAANEIARVTRPGGILLALMPTTDVLWENHLKMPLVHRSLVGSKRQRMLMKGFRRAGFGTYRDMPDDEWINQAVIDLQTNIFYRSMSEYISIFNPHFKLVAEAEPAWARHRVRDHPLLRHGSRVVELHMLDGLLRLAVRWAVGPVLVFERLGAFREQDS